MRMRKVRLSTIDHFLQKGEGYMVLKASWNKISLAFFYAKIQVWENW